MEFAEPDYIINIHSHDPESIPRVGIKRDVEGDVLLYHPNKKESVVLNTVSENLILKGFKVQLLD